MTKLTSFSAACEACATGSGLWFGFRPGFIPDFVVKPVFFRRRTDLLKNSGLGIDECNGFRHPRLGIRFWIGQRHIEFQRVLVDAPVALDEAHLVAVRIAEMIDPRSVVVADGLHDEGISLPSANRISIPSRIGILRKRAP